MPRDLPGGTVTFLFTDVEGSTKLLHSLGEDAYAEALAAHRRVVREAVASAGGVEVDTQGDAFFVAFATAPAAVAAAGNIAARLDGGAIRVRAGLHTGTPLVTDEGYVGADVHRAARVAAAGHGGQVLVSATTAALVPSAPLRDLGEHRLKDLSAPERIFQLGDAEFPPLKSLHRTNLPVPATSFLGREGELEAVLGALARPGVRLLTLTGPGGTGKTRLALQAAGASADRFADGVWWVPLAALRDHALVLPAIAHALDATEDVDRAIGARTLLLLLDNFEQVVDAAGDVAALLSACPNLVVLVTSREPLHVTGEHEYAVPPFVPQEAVGFFLARARAVRPDVEAGEDVAEICRRLDDLPLALELAAARVKALSPRQILERLERRLPLLTTGARDLPERQRTLRATIEWSHDLLTDDEQRLFAALGVFAGGCTLEAAEDVAAADLDTLQSLVDKSLVRHTAERYWMLETIREFAAERLADSEYSDAVANGHAQHYLALAEQAEPHLRGDPGDWLDRLDRDRDNLRAAFARFRSSGSHESAFRLAAAAGRFWSIRGYAGEWRPHVEAVLAEEARPTAARAGALTALALLSTRGAERLVRAEAAVAAADALADDVLSAHARFLLAVANIEAGDPAAAATVLEQCAAEFRRLGDEHYVLLSLRNLAWAYVDLGDVARACATHEANLEAARAAGNRRIVATTLSALGGHDVAAGRVDRAATFLAESFEIHRDIGDRSALALDLARLGDLAATRGDAYVGAQLYACALRLIEELGGHVFRDEIAAEERALSGALDDAAAAEARVRGRALSLDAAAALALGEPYDASRS